METDIAEGVLVLAVKNILCPLFIWNVIWNVWFGNHKSSNQKITWYNETGENTYIFRMMMMVVWWWWWCFGCPSYVRIGTYGGGKLPCSVGRISKTWLQRFTEMFFEDFLKISYFLQWIIFI